VRFLLDESTEFRIASFLRALGHDVTAIAHKYPASLPDSDVLALADAERRILITNDRDFGELIFRLNRPHAGVIYFRLGLASTAEEKIARLEQVLTRDAEQLGSFLVVTPSGIRVR
jgi:predicted nuclease of predicted toxin-antitoxin system